ncbi:hypothetical protein [Vibrio hepatarius]|uniref:hypothetical protein n=1 Tax=Vibrio hepatarius TaxID=171383 RepID=UPI001C0A4660|nr:hypothetical protein [Vibrio hepatarius]MBU2896089.1 hypothetical protein [Vibrio hepatarius]
MNNIELRIMPSKVVFTVWIQHLLHLKRASFSKKYEHVIELNSGVCSMFGFGRHIETNHPIIAAPRPLIPWLFMGKINRVIIAGMKSVYIEFGEPETPFYMCIKCSRKRIACLLPKYEETQDLVKTIDFHGYVITGESGVEITKALNRAPIQIVKSFDEISPPKTIDAEDWNDNLEQGFDIYDTSNFENLKDPLVY